MVAARRIGPEVRVLGAGIAVGSLLEREVGVVVGDGDGRTGLVAQGSAAGGTAERHREGLGTHLEDAVIENGNGNRGAHLPRDERHRAGACGIVGAGHRGAVARRIIHRDRPNDTKGAVDG